MIVLAIGAIFIASLMFFFYLIFGKIEDESQETYGKMRNENAVPRKPGNERSVALKTYKIKPEKEVVLK